MVSPHEKADMSWKTNQDPDGSQGLWFLSGVLTWAEERAKGSRRIFIPPPPIFGQPWGTTTTKVQKLTTVESL